MDVCGKCDYYNKGKCLASGFLGCSDEELLKIKADDLACETFSSNEE